MTEDREIERTLPASEEWYARIVAVPAGSAGFWPGLKILLTVVIGLSALNYYAPAPPTLTERVLASTILASIALPVWIWMCGADRTIPFMPFVTLIFAYFFALPIFLLRHFATGLFNSPIPDRYIELALGYALVGMYSMFAGYYGPARWLFAGVVPRFNLRWHDERVTRQLGLVLGIAGLIISTSRVESLLPESLWQVGVYAADLSMVGIFILVALQLTGRLNRPTSILLWGFLIPARTMIGLGSGAAAAGLMVGASLAFMFAALRHRIPWKMLALGTVALFILRPAETPFRAATWGGRMADASAAEKTRLFANIVYQITLGGVVPPQVLIEFAGLRLAQFTVFAQVIMDTPDRVPYWEGETYYPILFKPIPRFVMRDKPEEITGQTFGHRYALISQRNQNTSINLPQIVELYANFGPVAVVLGMFLFGLIYRLTLELYVHPGMGLGAVVAITYISSKLFDVGSAGSQIFGAIPWTIVFMAIIHMLMCLAEVDAMPNAEISTQGQEPELTS